MTTWPKRRNRSWTNDPRTDLGNVPNVGSGDLYGDWVFVSDLGIKNEKRT
jgi:hypothetical protein